MFMRIAVYCEDKNKGEELKVALEPAGFAVVVLPISAGFAEAAPAVAVIIRAGDQTVAAKARALKDVGDQPVIAALAGPRVYEAAVEAADDFVVEPFSPGELELRLKRLVGPAVVTDIVRVEGLTLDPESYEAAIDGRRLQLTFKEYELLKFLATHPGRVWSRQTLLNQIWEYDYFGGTRTVDVHIRRLRAKLGRYGNLIKTVRQVGYKFTQ